MRNCIVFDTRTGNYMGDEYGNVRIYSLQGARALVTKSRHNKDINLAIYELNKKCMMSSPSGRYYEPHFTFETHKRR